MYRVEPKYPIQPAYVFDKTALKALKQWRYKATGKTTKNLLVQLDYLMDDSSAQPEPLIERIKVKN